MKSLSLLTVFLILSIFELTSCNSDESTSYDYNPVWNEEFNDEGLPDESIWAYELGNGCPTLCGWGNNERQLYVKSSDNIRVQDGKLIIEAHNNRLDSIYKYTSARITTKGKKSWKYGYLEVRAKIPTGKGTWPAIWMLPLDWKYGGWPASGEIDIMEHVGYDPGVVHGTVHTTAYNHKIGTQKGKQIKLDNLDDFNIYAINWTPKKIDFLVNGEIYNTFENNGQGSEYWPYDQQYYLILNIAVGGDWGGKMGIAEDIWPQKMEIDYIRVYEYKQDLTGKKNNNKSAK